MPPCREPLDPSETNFLDFGQFGEAIASAIHALRPPQKSTLETVSQLQINNFFGNEGPEKYEIWIDLVEKTFLVM